jgi:hypothetical protein
VEIDFQPEITFDLDLTFGLNPEDGFFILDTGDEQDPEMSLEAGFDVVFERIGGSIGPLDYGVLNGHFLLAAGFAVNLVDPNPPASGEHKITVEELVGNFSTVFDPEITGNASLTFPQMGIRLGEDGPGIITSFSAYWNADNPDTFTFGPEQSPDPRDGFGPIQFELGEFVHDLIGPVLHNIKKYNPLPDELVEALYTELPIINVTPMDMIEQAVGEVTDNEDISLLFDIVNLVNKLVYDLPAGGTIDLSPFLDEGSDGGSGGNPPPPSDGGDDGPFDAFVNELKGYGINLPIIDDPAGTLVNLLVGEDVTLIEWDPDKFSFGYEFRESWQVFAYGYPGIAELVLNAYITGFVEFFGDLHLGFSTRGFTTTGDFWDGFFIGDNIHDGKDNFEVGFTAGVGAGITGSARLLGFWNVLEIGGGGGIFGTIGLDVSDLDPDEDLDPCDRRISRLQPNHPGADNKIYLDEIDFYLDHET